MFPAMPAAAFISVDQNSHPLWDTVPKLAALVRHGWHGTHAVEDVDVAFTRQGAHAPDGGLELAPERYYRSGNSDWGAALFYSEFLGRNAIDLRSLEPYLGWTVAALARRLEVSVDELYEQYAGSDNWQLIGASYAGDTHFHRVIGDIGTRDTAPFLQLLVEYALENLLEVFPEAAAQQRIRDWFAAESALLAGLLSRHANGPLVELYRAWVRHHLPDGVDVRLTSELFSPAALADTARRRPLELFVSRYPDCAALYNEAVAETHCGLKPLQPAQGELPFFVVCRHGPHLARTGVALQDGALVAGDRHWPVNAGQLPLEAMGRDGVLAVTGKALLLVLQARLQPDGSALALPYNGSLYMPAAFSLERKLRTAGLLPQSAAPVVRVKFDFLQAWQGCRTRLRVPPFLRPAFSADELAADAFAAEVGPAMARARAELETLRSKDGRDRLLRQLFPAESARQAELEAERRRLAAAPETRAQAARLWDTLKPLEHAQLRRLLERVLMDHYLLNLDYWNSRGALLPWSVALGGREFYDRLLQQATLYEEWP